MPSKLGAQVLIVSDESALVPPEHRDARVVRTPLDLILALDGAVDRVVLAGWFARERGVAAFLRDAYPDLAIEIAREKNSSDNARVPTLAYA